MITIDYASMSGELAHSIRSVEDRPHVLYIRYLLTKCAAPSTIHRDLMGLSLSAPTEEGLRRYWEVVCMPEVKRFGLTKIYQGYFTKMARPQKPHSFDRLSFKLQVAKYPKLITPFCLFVRELGVGDFWVREIVRGISGAGSGSGSADAIPRDERGVPILEYTEASGYQSVLACGKRELVERCLLEGMSARRASEFLRVNHRLELHPKAIASYQRYFFNVRRRALEETLDGLRLDLEALDEEIAALEADDSEDDLSARMTKLSSLNVRRQSLRSMIRDATMNYSEDSFHQGTAETMDTAEMFQEIVRRSYRRFLYMDQFKTPEAGKSLYEIVRTMDMAAERASPSGRQSADAPGESTIARMYVQRQEEILAAQNPDGLTAEDVEGMEPGQ